MNITACLTTLNAEACLARCLTSLRPLVDEIVIIDRGSTDRTPFIATDFNARFIRQANDLPLTAKAQALQKATREWTLHVAADEEPSADLLQQLTTLKSQTPAVSGYTINLVKMLNGQQIRFGKNYPNPQLRLVQKAKATFAVNDQLQVEGTVEALSGELLQHADNSSLQATPPYRFFAALSGYLFKGGLKHGSFGWQVAKLDAAK